jgi:hypothetical protein
MNSKSNQTIKLCPGSHLPPNECFGQLANFTGFTTYRYCTCLATHPLTEEERAKLHKVALQKLAGKAARVNARLMQSYVFQYPRVNPLVNPCGMPPPLPPLPTVSVPLPAPLAVVPVPLPVPMPPPVPVPVPPPVPASRLRAYAPVFVPASRFRADAPEFVPFCWSYY